MNMLLALILFIISCVTWIAFWVYLLGDHGDRDKNIPVVILLVVSILLTVYWFITWLPWFQPLFFYMFYLASGWWLVCLIILAIASVIGILARSWGVWGILFGVGVFVWLIFGAAMNDAWVKERIYHSLQYEEIKVLPDTTAVRYLPMEVAWRYGENRLQEPMVKHIDADPVIKGDEVQWVLARGPKGFWNEWLDTSDGFTTVDNKGDVATIHQKMTVGEGMEGSDNILWKLRQKRYWVSVPEIYPVQGKDGQVVEVAPYLRYYLDWPVMVPYFGGVFIVYSNGAIEDLTPEQAKEHPLLKDIRIFPEELARTYVEAYVYKNGIWNTIVRHEDQIEIPKVGTLSGYRVRGNEMPFLLPTKIGQKWFIAANPWGAEGIYRIFFVDAISQQIKVFNLSKESTLIGPGRARDYITRAYPTFDWDKILVLEPRPIVKDGVLYWMFTITPKTLAGVVDTVLVNSKTNEVLSFGSDYQKILRFLKGEKVGTLVGVGETPISSTGQLTPSTPAIQPTIGLSRENIRQLIEGLRAMISQLEQLERSLPQK